jgi:hypothetical protein
LCRTTRAPEWRHQHGISRLRSGFDIVPADKDNLRNLSKAEGVTADGACTPAYVIGPVRSSWGHRIRRARVLEGQLQSVWAAYRLTTDRRISQEAADELQICRFRETQRVSWTEVARSVPAALTTAPPQRFTVVSRPVAETSPRVPTRNGLGCTFLGPYRQVRTGDVNAGSLRTPFHPARRARTFWQCWQVPTSSGTVRHPSRHHTDRAAPSSTVLLRLDRQRRFHTFCRINSASGRTRRHVKTYVRAAHGRCHCGSCCCRSLSPVTSTASPARSTMELPCAQMNPASGSDPN